MPNENQKQLVSNLLSLMGNDDKTIYKQIIDVLFELGYVPQRQKSNDLILDFKNNKLNEKIAKIGVRGTDKPKPSLSLKFYASSDYSQKFKEGLQKACNWHFTEAGKKYTKKIDSTTTSIFLRQCKIIITNSNTKGGGKSQVLITRFLCVINSLWKDYE